MSKILIVDDDAMARMIFRAALESLGGHEVAEAESSAEAEAALAAAVITTSPIALILLDGSLADGSGVEWLKSQENNDLIGEIPVIFVTASTDMAPFVQSRAFAALQKPVDPAQLIDVVARALAG